MVQSLRGNRNCKIYEMIWHIHCFCGNLLFCSWWIKYFWGAGFYLTYSFGFPSGKPLVNFFYMRLPSGLGKLFKYFWVKALNSIFLTPNQRVNISWFLSFRDMWVRTSKIKISELEGALWRENHFLYKFDYIQEIH